MTTAAITCLYLLMFCPVDAIAPTAAALPHGDGYWAIYQMQKDGTERATTYDNADDCALDSAVLRDGGEGSVCYALL